MDFFGKYEGIVKSNKDPEGLGRLRVSVPSVLRTNDLNWARPCVPYAGKNVGFYMMPPEGASVWVEFLNGDLNYPIWSGCYWKPGDLSPDIKPSSKFIKTQRGQIMIEEEPGKEEFFISLQASPNVPPLSLKFTADTLELIYDQQTNIVLTSEKINVTSANASVQIGQDEISIAQSTSSIIKVASTGINMNHGALEVL